MCLGELARVVSVDGDVAVVVTARGRATASLLLTPAVGAGDDVVVHSGHVLSVVTPDEAATATALRAGRPPTTTGG